MLETMTPIPRAEKELRKQQTRRDCVDCPVCSY